MSEVNIFPKIATSNYIYIYRERERERERERAHNLVYVSCNCCVNRILFSNQYCTSEFALAKRLLNWLIAWFSTTTDIDNHYERTSY